MTAPESDPEDEAFGLAQLEERWKQRPTDPVRDRFAHVQSPVDPGILARRALDRLETLLVGASSPHREVLTPFLAQIRQLTESAWPSPPAASASSPPAAPPADPEAPPAPEETFERMDDVPAVQEAAAQLVIEVEQLEDLLEALHSAT